jgi:hypothetical protein
MHQDTPIYLYAEPALKYFSALKDFLEILTASTTPLERITSLTMNCVEKEPLY